MHLQHVTHIQTLTEFWALVIDVWDHGFMGIAVGQIVLAILVLALATAIRRLFSSAVLRYVRLWLRRSKSLADDTLVEALTPPVRFIPIVFAIFIVSGFITANPQTKAAFAEINRSLIAFTLFWGLLEIIQPLFSVFDARTAVFSHAMIGWAVRVSKILVVALARIIREERNVAADQPG